MRVPKALACVLLALASITACAPTQRGVIMHDLRAQLAQQPHECVPLGWVPVVGAGTYHPGYSAELQEQGVWLHALWIGYVSHSDLADSQGRIAYNVLNELVRVGLVARQPFSSNFRYHLTLRGLPYYMDQNHYGDNPDHLAYLCYSTLVPQNVVWNQPMHVERDGDAGLARVSRAAFQWRSSPIADWANDPFLRSHSVTLAPTGMPVTAKFVRRDRKWQIESLSEGVFFPTVVDASAWSSPPAQRGDRAGRIVLTSRLDRRP